MSSGTLYFNATRYSAQYAIEYSYDSSTFYIDSVKVKLSQYVSVWWGFTLTVKINDTVIHSGTDNYLVDTFDWYDLGISGSADITDEVTVSIVGSAIHDNYQFNVASPTSQTVSTGSSGDSGDSGSDSYRMYISEGEGTELTVIRTWNEATGTGGQEDLSNYREVSVVYKDYFDITVEALEGYQNQRLEYSNLNFVDSIGVHCTLADYGDVYVSSIATLKEYRLSATAGKGSTITVRRTSSKKSGASLGVLSNGATIYHFDTLEVISGVESGYDIEDTTVTGCIENTDGTFTVVNNVSVTTTTTVNEYKLTTTVQTGAYVTITRKSTKKSGASLGTLSNGAKIYHFDVLQITYGANTGYEISDANITGCSRNSDGTYTVVNDTSVIIITGRLGMIYVDNGTNFVPCLIYIDNGSSWEQCIPYVDSGTSWNLCS